MTSPGSSLTNMYVGSLGSLAYSGTITPGANNVYRLGGAGEINISTQLTGVRSLIAGNVGGPTNAIVILSGTNNFTGSATAQSGELRIASPNALPAGIITTLSAGARLTLAAGAGMVGDKVLAPSLLTVAGAPHNGTILPTARLDLGNNDAVLPATSYSVDEFRRLIGSAYAGGLWSGNGITTSVPTVLIGLGNVDSATFQQAFPGTSTFDGVTLNPNQVLVKYTYFGDTNLDGAVDAADLSNLLAGMNGGLTGWINGDTDYDNDVDATDLARLLTGLQGQGAPLTWGGGGTSGGSVPEPAGMALVCVAGVATRARRRR